MSKLYPKSKVKLYPISTGHRVGFIRGDIDESFEDVGHGVIQSSYSVCNFGDWKIPLMYVAKVKFDNKVEWLVWYRHSKKLWSSYGKTRLEAVEGAIRDGWLYA